MILLRIFQQLKGWKSKIIDYMDSGDTMDDLTSVVGYSAVEFCTVPEEFSVNIVNDFEKQFLLKLARDTVEQYVKGRTTPSVDAARLSSQLNEVRGCFVTLKKDGNLRGCIGHIIPRVPLYECVIENAIHAATADSRFPAVSVDELKDIDLEISVLTLPERLFYNSSDDLLALLRPGVDGVVMYSGFRMSTFLPQVWEIYHNDKIVFLEALCEKQGSSKDCWKTAKYEVYQAQVFGEKK